MATRADDFAFDPHDDHAGLAARVDDDGTSHAAPDFEAPRLISPAILASLEEAADRAAFGAPIRDVAIVDHPRRAAPRASTPPADWLADLTHWMIANNDRVGRWIEHAILALIAAMTALMLWHLGPLALRAVL